MKGVTYSGITARPMFMMLAWQAAGRPGGHLPVTCTYLVYHIHLSSAATGGSVFVVVVWVLVHAK